VKGRAIVGLLPLLGLVALGLVAIVRLTIGVTPTLTNPLELTALVAVCVTSPLGIVRTGFSWSVIAIMAATSLVFNLSIDSLYLRETGVAVLSLMCLLNVFRWQGSDQIRRWTSLAPPALAIAFLLGGAIQARGWSIELMQVTLFVVTYLLIGVVVLGIMRRTSGDLHEGDR
jgi:hypothetical protein